jgi:hypothetical protein
VRRLEEHQRTRLAGQPLERLAPFAGARRQEPLERESVRGQARDAERGRDRGGPGDRPDRDAAAAARTIAKPGSEISGVPASLTRAMTAPAPSRAMSSATRASSLCSCSDSSGRDTPIAASKVPVRRVSSAATRSAPASAARARGDRSATLPIGDAITSSRPDPAITIILRP